MEDQPKLLSSWAISEFLLDQVYFWALYYKPNSIGFFFWTLYNGPSSLCFLLSLVFRSRVIVQGFVARGYGPYGDTWIQGKSLAQSRDLLKACRPLARVISKLLSFVRHMLLPSGMLLIQRISRHVSCSQWRGLMAICPPNGDEFFLCLQVCRIRVMLFHFVRHLQGF